MKIKAECSQINAPLPVIDAENDGVLIIAAGCEKYMSLLKYGQYGQVGVDGVWRDKSDDKKATIKSDDKGITEKSAYQQARVLEYMEVDKEYQLREFCDLLGLKETRIKGILKPLIERGKIVVVGKNRDRRYKLG